MNSHDDNPASVDALARQLHRQALGAVSPATLARLRDGRHAATQAAPAHRGGWRWLVAGAVPVTLAAVLGLQWLHPGPAPSTPGTVATPATAVASSDYRDVGSMLDENPDLYLWLASSEAQPVAME